jgi:uncharacterized protein YjiS (DUF1127 family)
MTTMSAPLSTDTIAPPLGQNRFWSKAVRVVRATLAAWSARQAILHLTELDDRQLKDIGLLRGDVEGALSGSMLADPSQHLVVKACQRRADDKAAMRAGLRRMDLEAAPAAECCSSRVAA